MFRMCIELLKCFFGFISVLMTSDSHKNNLLHECFLVQIHRSLWVSVLAYHTDVEDLLWLPAILVCHLQHHEHDWWQRNATVQQFQNHLMIYQIGKVVCILVLWHSTSNEVWYLSHIAIQYTESQPSESMKCVCYLCHAVTNNKHGDRFWFRWRFTLMHVYDNGMKCHWTLDQW
jgi:hypothetical protein